MTRYRKSLCSILIFAMLIAIFPIASYSANEIKIIESGGYCESAYVKWTGGEGLGSTNVYWKKSGTAN